MKQSMNLHVDQLAGNAIVPIEANGFHATAFFISPNHLLTARHFVIDAGVEENEEDVICIKAGGNTHYCKYTEFADKGYDAVLVTTKNFKQQPDFILELLSAPMIINQKLCIIGYPKELGNNIDYFAVDVENYKELSDYPLGYDTLVRRTENNIFQSYKGFSGSPVVNQCKQVIGLVTDQFTGTLGYMSIYRMANTLKKMGVTFSADAESADDRTFGLYTSRKLMAQALGRASSRYNERLNQENGEFTNLIDNITKRNYHNPYLHIWDKYLNWVKLVGSSFDSYPKFIEAIKALESRKYQEIKFEDIRRLVCAKDPSINLLDKDDYPDERLMDKLKDIGYDLSDVEEAEKEYSTQFVCISGSAGTGKTHLLCHYSKMYNGYSHAYLLFGSDFHSDSRDAFDEILNNLSMSIDDIERLNNHLNAQKRYGIIVIDALNEGAGQHYWKKQMPALKTQLQKYPRLKLIVSARYDSDKYILGNDRNDWYCLRLSGFENQESAVTAYFREFGIPDNAKNLAKDFPTFQNPLFLYIFCTAYKSMPYEARKNITLLTIFKYYLQERNRKVSELVDEDPLKNITTAFLLEIARESVINHNCDVISRNKAREIADSLSIIPGWKHNLLHVCEAENLLRMTYRKNKDWSNAFEFENLGDFLKAKVWYEEYQGKPYTELLDDIKNRLKDKNRTKDLEHTIEALLSIYDAQSALWQEEIILNGELTKYVMQSLQYHRPAVEFEDFTSRIINGIYKKNANTITPAFLRDHINDIGYSAMKMLHDELTSKTQNELDAFWTDKVNRLYAGRMDEYGLRFTASIYDKQRALTHTMLMCWFAASSYPIIRAYAQRAIVEDFTNCPASILETLQLFKDVKDPYVIQSLYASLYGFLLRHLHKLYAVDPLFGFNLTEEIKKIGDYVYGQYYSSPERVPQDIIIRYWQMKTLDSIAYMIPSSECWEKIKAQKRFIPQKTPLYSGNEILENDVNCLGVPENKNYQLVDSLFSHMSDFCRYTLHMNNTSKSRTYLTDKEDKDSGVDMLLVQRSIINQIKEEIGWNEHLAELDHSHSTSSRMNNDKERIGKKYQWMALYKIEAYLSDTCYMRENFWSDDKIAENNYPWYSPNRPYFDPTLSSANMEVAKQLSSKFSFPNRELMITKNELEEWKNSIPEYFPVFIDSDGIEWVPLYLFDTRDTDLDHSKDMPQLHQFIFYNSFFFDKNDSEKLYSWACQQDFGGRWMPEPGESIGYLWNEYPWSESYKKSCNISEYKWKDRDCPTEITDSCVGELQENTEGLPQDTEFISTVYAPNPYMMEMFGLYTAERGIVRKKENDEIVSFNIMRKDTCFLGMLIKKAYLMEYIKRTNQRLFVCLCGEKYGTISGTGIGFESYSGCYQINGDGDIVYENRLHLVKQPKPQRIQTGTDPMDILSHIELIESREKE